MRTLILASLASVAATSSLQAEPRRGVVSSRVCPYSCRTEGIPKSDCKDWREGNTCFVEDRRVTAGNNQAENPPAYVQASSECRDIPRTRIRKPNIEVSRERPGNNWNDRIKVQGTVEGQCLTEAGYYEDGRKIQSIPLVTSRDFQRFDFDIKARGGRDPEIRVYNVHGDRDIHYVDEDYARGRFDDEAYNDTEYFDPLGGIFGR
jgi:hypothetical protein